MSDRAIKLWRQACGVLLAPTTESTFKVIEEYTAPDTVWHSLGNCVAHQADLWTTLLASGIDDVIQPAAFKLAIVLRHTPPVTSLKILADLLKNHPQAQDITDYVLALLTDDEAQGAGAEGGPVPAAPLRDLQVYGDCELAVLAAPPDVYARHSELVRAEYAQLNHRSYLELRIKVLNQFQKIPAVFHTPEFAHLEQPARDNITREINMLKSELRKQ